MQIDFTQEEIELLQSCLSKYFYDVNGIPKVVISCYEKLEKAREKQ